MDIHALLLLPCLYLVAIMALTVPVDQDFTNTASSTVNSGIEGPLLG